MENDRRKIVIIEDEPDTAEMYAEMMRISGYQVEIYFGGSSALSQIAEGKPAAVVLDLMMPDLSGLDVLNYMKAEQGLSDIPVIIVSAKSMPEEIDEGLNAGAYAYLTKPVSFSELKKAIDDAVSLSVEGKR
jgi:DNA-binding response OmpR family regulator